MVVYPDLKWLHALAVAVRGAGLLLRAALSWSAPHLLHTRFLRIAPHVNDAVLLTAGVTMAVAARISPLTQPWLAAKLLALPVYIALGMLALERGRRLGLPAPARLAAFVGASTTFAYILAVAWRRHPLPWT